MHDHGSRAATPTATATAAPAQEARRDGRATRVGRDGELRLTQRREGGRYVLCASGELDLSSAGTLERYVGELCTDSAGEIALDLSALGFMDSTGLRSLLVSKELCEVAGCGLVLSATTPEIDKLLELAGLSDVLPRADA
jgi:stage II sporulation protein AA (anti-sigma F factor antagonist)